MALQAGGLLERWSGRWRAARCRCPACASEDSGCPVCFGYRTPFPPSPDERRRWWARFEQSLDARRTSALPAGPVFVPRRSGAAPG